MTQNATKVVRNITYCFYLPETGETVDTLPPERYELFIKDLRRSIVNVIVQSVRMQRMKAQQNQNQSEEDKNGQA